MDKTKIANLVSSCKSWLITQKERHQVEIFDFLKIKSISTLPEYKDQIEQAAIFCTDLLKKIGCNNARIITGYGNPIVYGEIIKGKNLPTILFYGHYDVQPEGDVREWQFPPFEPTIHNGKIYARGASDDKIPVYANIEAVHFLIKHNLLNCNVKFLVEGEEEIGSVNLKQFVKENKEFLKADYCIISDTSISSLKNPVITTGVRGLLYVEMRAEGPNKDLHSGTFGGAIRNPLYELARIISLIRDDDGKILLNDFYNDVIEPSPEELFYAQENSQDKEILAELEVKEFDGSSLHSFLMKTTLMPSFDVNGIIGGYIGKGSKTVLPAYGIAKISFRLIPNQDPDKIFNSLSNFIKYKAHPGVRIVLNKFASAKPVAIPVNSIELQKTTQIMETVLGVKPIYLRSGGTIPVVSYIYEELNLHSILLGLGTNFDNAHGPNESFPWLHFSEGVPLLAAVYHFIHT